MGRVEGDGEVVWVYQYQLSWQVLKKKMSGNEEEQLWS